MGKNGKVYFENGARVLPPSNSVEHQCYDEMRAQGYTVIKSGYPDLFCFKEDKIVLVECKPKETQGLKTNQRLMLELFSKYGIPCYKYTPTNGFEKIE